MDFLVSALGMAVALIVGIASAVFTLILESAFNRRPYRLLYVVHLCQVLRLLFHPSRRWGLLLHRHRLWFRSFIPLWSRCEFDWPLIFYSCSGLDKREFTNVSPMMGISF